jgi:hypothetical protein
MYVRPPSLLRLNTSGSFSNPVCRLPRQTPLFHLLPCLIPYIPYITLISAPFTLPPPNQKPSTSAHHPFTRERTHHTTRYPRHLQQRNPLSL